MSSSVLVPARHELWLRVLLPEVMACARRGHCVFRLCVSVLCFGYSCCHHANIIEWSLRLSTAKRCQALSKALMNFLYKISNETFFHLQLRLYNTYMDYFYLKLFLVSRMVYMKRFVIIMSVFLLSEILSKSTSQYILLEYAFMRSKLQVIQNRSVKQFYYFQ